MQIEMTDRLANAINDVDKALTEHGIEVSLVWSELVWVAINKVYEYHPKFNTQGCQSGRFQGENANV